MKKQTKKQTAKFQTPHQKASAAKKEAKAKQEAKATPPAPKTQKANGAKRDAFGGLVGSRCSKINVAVIEAGKTGATVKEVAEQTGEDASLVSAQLGWIAKTKAELLKRKPEGKSFRYFAA